MVLGLSCQARKQTCAATELRFFPSSHLHVGQLHQPSSENLAAHSTSLRVEEGMLEKEEGP